MRADAGKVSSRERCSSTSRQGDRSSPSFHPDGAAAELIRETGAGVVVAPDDVGAISIALTDLHSRFADGGLASVELAKTDEDRLSRRARVEEMASLLRTVV